MLRGIKHSYIRPRILLGTVETAGSSSTLGVSKEDITGVRNGAGDSSLTFLDPFRRSPLLFVTPERSAGAGQLGNYISSAVNGARIISRTTSTGVGVEGVSNFAALGWDSAEDGCLHPNSNTLVSSWAHSRMITTKLTYSGGAIAVSSSTRHLTATRTATGVYTLTFLKPFSQAPVIIGSPLSSGSCTVNISSRTNTGAVIHVCDSSGNATDTSIFLMIAGKDSQNNSGRHRRVIETVRRLPKLHAFRVTITGGVPALTLGGESASIADTGTGDFTITIRALEAFRRAPEVFTSASGSNIAVVAGVTANTIEIKTFSGAAAADASVVDIMAVGFDDAGEY